jgi:site-specific DNA-methyltransferase (adenine-specific)
MALSPALFTSTKNDWETPKDLFERLNSKYHFAFDLAASSTNHKCDRYFTEHDDALSQDWTAIKGPLFLNPPYGRNLRQWVEKACKTASTTNLTIVLLIPARTDTSYWHDFIFGKAKVEFIRGRLKFEVNGIPSNSAPFPSAIVIYNKPVEVEDHE